MNARALQKLPTTNAVALGTLQRKCACGGTPGPTGECEACRKKRLQRKGKNSVIETKTSFTVSPGVHEVLRSPGQSLDAETRAVMETRLGYNFGDVRVHTDAAGAASAHAVNALAYTVGRNVVFGVGQYDPRSREGRELVAHELTHVVQQARGARNANLASEESAEQEAEGQGRMISQSLAAPITASVALGTLQRQEKKNPLDDAAKAIIAKAKDEKTSADKRAAQLINDIIAAYYAGDAAKVDSVVFDDAKAGTGLHTESVGSGATAKGKIFVGNYFVKNVDSFARRVLQVGHELEHIHQYRSGLAGGQNKDKREFLAFNDEALVAEKPGTGRMSYATRLALVDSALGYFYCLSTDDQTAFESKKQALLKRRDEVNGKGGNLATDAPTACKRQ